jgi:hypothetical protein
MFLFTGREAASRGVSAAQPWRQACTSMSSSTCAAGSNPRPAALILTGASRVIRSEEAGAQKRAPRWQGDVEMPTRSLAKNDLCYGRLLP